MKTQKAIFLDRDGTIIIDKNYLSRVEDIEYYSDTMKALQIMQQKGYDLFLITNQSGVNRGYFPMENVHAIHNQIQSDLKHNHLHSFKDIAICPHTPDEDCACRKPKPKLILDLVNKYNLDPFQCYMIGDKAIDAECGKNAGMKGILVRHSSSSDYPNFKTLLDFSKTLV